MNSDDTKPTAADLRQWAMGKNVPTVVRDALLADADAMDERDRLRAENAELAEALQPFADKFLTVTVDDGAGLLIPIGNKHFMAVGATLSDLRRAAAVLAKRERVIRPWPMTTCRSCRK